MPNIRDIKADRMEEKQRAVSLENTVAELVQAVNELKTQVEDLKTSLTPNSEEDEVVEEVKETKPLRPTKK